MLCPPGLGTQQRTDGKTRANGEVRVSVVLLVGMCGRVRVRVNVMPVFQTRACARIRVRVHSFALFRCYTNTDADTRSLDVAATSGVTVFFRLAFISVDGLVTGCRYCLPTIMHTFYFVTWVILNIFVNKIAIKILSVLLLFSAGFILSIYIFTSIIEAVSEATVMLLGILTNLLVRVRCGGGGRVGGGSRHGAAR